MSQPDVLLALRQAISSDRTPVLTTSSDSNADANGVTSLAQATHLRIPGAKTTTYPLSTTTRFLVNSTAVNLRSVFFAWQNKDLPPHEYINAFQALNDQLPANDKLVTLPFAERLDLNSWLGNQQDDSEYIQPLEGAGQQSSAVDSGAGVKRKREVDDRLQQIYHGERRICDRNSILHGIKPTDFAAAQKQVYTMFRSKIKAKPMNDPAASASLVSNLKKPNHRPSPIILLSPSASSLLRLTNIKKFLEEGVFVPADSALASQTGANQQRIMRSMPSIDATRALQFLFMETTDQFRPEYWSRLVAVFTTGQEWQFKSYKWSTAQELFSRVLGIHVGYQGETAPENVKNWGRIVKTLAVEKWNPSRGESGRWRDREVVEGVWMAIEESMRIKGWARENGYK